MSDIGTRSWNVLCVDANDGCSGKDCLVKGLFGLEGYEVMLSDGVTVWEEEMKAPEILERLKVSRTMLIMGLCTTSATLLLRQ